MNQEFATALVDAQGRSEFIIVVVADIRGFSAFSTIHESPNIAMFIKRFYLQLINKYFSSANFVKPTGDGLLMTFPYSETDLLEVSEEVISSCLSCLMDFPTICKDDPMINFPVPQAIGFGIARGTACCLYSGDETLDYSGHLLNLASRLNDLARPSGIVIDGSYLKSVIPNSSRDLFKEQEVYVRSIAEDSPMAIFYLKDHVAISESSLSPMTSENWHTSTKEYTAKKMAGIASRLRWNLNTPAKSREKIRVTVLRPKPGMKGHRKFTAFTKFNYLEDGPRPCIELDMDKMREQVKLGELAPTTKIVLRLDYIPKSSQKD